MINSFVKGKLITELDNVNSSVKKYVDSLNDITGSFIDDINNNLLYDDVFVQIEIKDIESNQLLKNNMRLSFFKSGNSDPTTIQNLESGVQRNIVNTILTQSGMHSDVFALILYDEPPALETFTLKKRVHARHTKKAWN